MNRFKLFHLFVLLAAATFTMAQPVCQVRKFSLYNGLPQRTVSDIAQDRKGFIWMATWNGISRYDGYHFKNYKAHPGDSCSLNSNRFQTINVDTQGRILCLTHDGGAYLFDPTTEQFSDLLRDFQSSTKHIVIKSIHRLRKGVTWLLANDMAFRMDEAAHHAGEPHAIVRYSKADGNLRGKFVHHIRQDTQGDEWILTDEGVTLIGRKRLHTHDAFKEASEKAGKIYLLSTDEQLAIYDMQRQSLRYLPLPMPYQRLISIQHTDKHIISIGTDRGIINLDTRTEQLSHLDLQQRLQGRVAEVRRIYCAQDGNWWIFTQSQGVVRYNPAHNQLQYYRSVSAMSDNGKPLMNDLFLEDAQGRVWLVPHYGQLHYYDPATQSLVPYYTDETKRSTPVIRCHHIDRQGNLWFGNKLDAGCISFLPNASERLSFGDGSETRAFLTDRRGRLWMANKDGIVYLIDAADAKRQKKVRYLNANGQMTAQFTTFGANIYTFLEDSQGHIWMGSRWDGLFRLTPQDEQGLHYDITHYTHQVSHPYSLSNNSIYYLMEDSRGRIWVATHGGGINYIEDPTADHIRFINHHNELKAFPERQRYSRTRIIREIDSTLLVGTTEGLISFSSNFARPDQVTYHVNNRRPNAPNSLASNDISYIYQDSQKHNFVLSFTGGINEILSPDLLSDSIRFRPYSLLNGLPNDLPLSMIEDEKKRLWVVTENALTLMDAATHSFRNYDKRYFNREVYYSEAQPALWQGKLVLGTENGAILSNPDFLKPSSYVPPIVFTGLRIQGMGQQRSIDHLTELSLEPDERNVSFHFAALDYVEPMAISYAYRLKGLEEEWNEVDNSRSATYINLPPGDYELEVRSTNCDGIWVNNQRSLTIHVIPVFWETPWATVLYVLAICLFITIVVYIITYIYRLHHQIDLEHRLSAIKLRFFTDISHELRTPLTLITSPISEVLEHEPLSPMARKHLTLVHTNTDRMLRLVNQILDFRKIENRKMKLLIEQTNISALIQSLMDNFRLMAEEKRIDFRLEMNPETITGWIDRDKVEKMVFNLLSNAFKYTPAGRSIRVKAYTEDDTLHLSVSDEGIGIAPDAQQSLFQRFETLVHSNILQPSSGIGLSLVKELVELHQGSIEVDSQEGKGSTFSITLPLAVARYKGNEYAEFILKDQEEAASETTSEPMERTASTEGENAVLKESETNSEEVPTRPTILIVEDNPELRSYMSDILRTSYRILTAVNGQEGLQMALDEQPDFILSDVMMPVMDGLEMVRAIKADALSCHIPIILLSAKSSLDDRIQGLEQGIDDYITKPFSSTYLKTRIRALLEQRHQMQQWFLNRMEETSLPIQADQTQMALMLSPEQPQIASQDEKFLERIMVVVEQQMDNADFTIDEFAAALNMGRTVFYQKIKTLVGLSPVDFLREMRLKRAMQLVESGQYNVSSIAYMTGFNDPKYFSKCFKKRWGQNPSDLTKKGGNENE